MDTGSRSYTADVEIPLLSKHCMSKLLTSRARLGEKEKGEVITSGARLWFVRCIHVPEASGVQCESGGTIILMLLFSKGLAPSREKLPPSLLPSLRVCLAVGS